LIKAETIAAAQCLLGGRSRTTAPAVALFAMYHNYDRIHKMLRSAAAMAAGIMSWLWGIGDIVETAELGSKQ
jgi:hypothetical protein